MNRCKWVNLRNPLYVAYHDYEWGRPEHDDRRLFQLLLLESFQAGLSWEIILNKREAFRVALDDFDADKISRYGEEKLDALMNNKDIIRCRRKLTAAIKNARAFLEIQKEFGSFDAYIWGFTHGQILYNTDGCPPAKTPLSEKISRDLKRRGMSFVGPTVVYSYLQAIGIVNDHEPDCHCRCRI